MKTENIDIILSSHASNLGGGAERSLLSMVLYLSKKDIKPLVVLPGSGEFSKQLDNVNIPYIYLNMPVWAHGKNDHSEYQFTNESGENFIHHLINLIRQHDPQVCVSNTIVSPWLAYAAAICGKRHAWIIRELGSIDHGLSYAIADYQVHRTVECFSDQVFYNSIHTANHYKDKIKTKHYGIIYPDISIELISNNKNILNINQHVNILIVGQVKESKGQFLAVKAVGKLIKLGYDLSLNIVGGLEDIEYAKSIKKYIKINNLENKINIVGFKNNPKKYYEQANISLVCSVNEAFGRVTIESMARGIPTIGSDSGGTAEIIINNQTGLLYKPGDVNSLLDKIKLLLDNPNLSSSLSVAARNDVMKRFSQESCYLDFINYYTKMQESTNDGIDLTPMIGLDRDFVKIISDLENKLIVTDNQLTETHSELLSIKNSRLWRCRTIIRNIFK